METNSTTVGTLDVQAIREDFPILRREVRPGRKLIYLDSAATTQKPVPVMEALDRFYHQSNANIHRGVHTLAEEATGLYEQARGKVANFIHAPNVREVVFTRNTTESINLVAATWGRANLRAGDVVVLTEMEHHSNLVPWQMLAAEKGIRLEFIPVTDDGLLDLERYGELLELKPKLVSFAQVSNVLGTVNPVTQMARMAHDAGALVLVDGAQAVPHFPTDVTALGADFYAFSGHKMCGPTGIGVLWGHKELLDAMPPYMGGGEMIKQVYLRSFTTNDVPHKFEAGTPAIAEAIGLGAAVDYLEGIGMDAIAAYDHELAAYALERLPQVPGLRLLGPRDVSQKQAVFAFALDEIHPHDVSQVLDEYGIAVRAGHHCAMPLHDRFGLTATTRASLYFYNTKEEIDALVEGLYKVKEVFD